MGALPQRIVEKAKEGDTQQVGNPAPQLRVETVEVDAVM